MSYIAERREEEKERRRVEILDAAEALYAKKGWDAVTVDQVARSARLSRALVYVYFRDKEELLFAIGERAMRLLRDLHLMDLVRISLLPASPVELRRLAEERVLAQLPQMPLGQRIMLARRGSARVAGGLIGLGPVQVSRIALDNSFLTESQLLRTLAKDGLPAQTVAAIAKHEKWSKLMNVRIALLRHPHSPVERVLSFLPDLARRDLEDLLEVSRLPGSMRANLRQELARREKI